MVQEDCINISYFVIRSKNPKGNCYYDKEGKLVSNWRDAELFDQLGIDRIADYLRFFDIDRKEVVIMSVLVEISEMDCVI